MTISLSDDMYRRIERARKAVKIDRSTFVQGAVERRLAADEHAARVAEYIRGYTEVPETDEEYEFSDAAAREMFRLLDADEAGEA